MSSVRNLLAAATAALATVLAAEVLPAQIPSSLSLDEALRIALDSNPDYLIQENQRGPARWAVRSAYGNWLPSANVSSSLGYTASGQRRFGDVELAERAAIYSSSYNLGLSHSLSGSTFLQPGLARAQERATDAQIDGAAAGLIAQVTQVYLSALQADAELEQAGREVERTREYVRLAEAQLEVGSGTPLDVRRAEVQLGQAEVRLLQAENSTATERLNLGRELGTPLDAEVALTTEFELFEPEWDSEPLVERAIANNPVLLAERAQLDASESRHRVARSEYLPSIGISAGLTGSVFQEAGSDAQNFPFGYQQQPGNVSVSLSLPVFTGLSRRYNREEARVAEVNARQSVRAEELRLQTEVASAQRALDTGYRIVQLQTQVRETAEEELRLASERFRYGVATSVEVTDAQTNLSEAEREEISAIYDFHQQLANLEALLGGPLR